MPNQAANWRARVATELGRDCPVVEKRRHGLKLSLGDMKYRVMRSIGPVHTKDGREIDTDLDGDTGAWLAKGRSLDFDVRIGTGGKRRITPRPERPDEYIEIGRPQKRNPGGQWANMAFSGGGRKNNEYSLTGPDYVFMVAVDADGLKTTIQINDPSALGEFRWPVEMAGLVDYAGGVLVSKSDGQEVLYMGTPRWRDSAKWRDRKQGEILYEWSDGHITYLPDIPEDAVYPVIIDPDFSADVTRTNDDGYVYYQFSTWHLQQYAAELVIENENAHTYLQFNDLTIPQGALINSAHLHLCGVEGVGDSPVTVRIYCLAENSHHHPHSYDEWSTDHTTLHTTAYTNWSFEPIQEGLWGQSDDFSGAVGEVISRTGWVSGNEIGIHLDGVSGYQVFESYDDSGDTAPQLDITYSEGVEPAAISRAALIPTPALRDGEGVSPSSVGCPTNRVQYLALDGVTDIAVSSYTAPLTGDLYAGARIRADDWTPSSGQFIMGHWGGSYPNDDCGWSLWLHTDGTLVFGITTNGLSSSAEWIASTASLLYYISELGLSELWVGVTFDASIGGNHATAFYVGTTNADFVSFAGWQQLGTTVISSGTRTLWSPSVGMSVGAINDPYKSSGFVGRIYQALAYNASYTQVISPKFDRYPWRKGVTTGVDAQGKHWTLYGGAHIEGTSPTLQYGGKKTFAASSLDGSTEFSEETGAGVGFQISGATMSQRQGNFGTHTRQWGARIIPRPE